MDGNLLRGNLDLILLAILEDRPRYGLEIIVEARERTGGYFDFREGSLYPALHRLEKTGLVEAEFQPSSSGGPRRRYYRVTQRGAERLEEKRREWKTFTSAVEALWANK